MAATGYRLPQNRPTWGDTINYLIWNQFPAILEKSVEYFQVLPQIGTYKDQVNDGVKTFREAVLETSGRQYTISGIGSLADYDQFGHEIRRPTPQLSGTGCNGNSLCLEPTCFRFVEGVIESANRMRDFCWSLSMPCLKDYEYSDARFSEKMRDYIEMFFKQGPAALEAIVRANLLRESVKIVCTDRNITFTGPFVGGDDGISLPFWIDPIDPLAFPDITAMGGAKVGGANLLAFANYLAPRLFSGAFSGGAESLKIYGLKSDWMIAKEQTASVNSNYLAQDLRNGTAMDKIDSLLGTFIHDPLFPTFAKYSTAVNPDVIYPITAEILEPATIAGFMQTDNPNHSLSKFRGAMMVPSNWKYNLIEPPKDDFSSLGLGEGMNFRNNTPGVFPIMSSSMFSRNSVGDTGRVVLGLSAGPNGGMVTQSAQGLKPRQQAISEAIRTQLIQTYSNNTCGQVPDGQLPNVGAQTVPQGMADGFALKSTIYWGTAVKGIARPVLLLWQIDNPRSAVPVVVCNTIEITLDTDAEGRLIDCAPGGQNYLILSFDSDMSTVYTVGDLAIWRTGESARTYLVEVTVVSTDGKVITVSSVDAEGDPLTTQLLPCCTGNGKDDYGTKGELTVTTGATALSSEVMKAKYDVDTDSYFLELLVPVAAGNDGANATITLKNGDVIAVELVDAALAGVFVNIKTYGGETCDLADVDCACLLDAIFAYDEVS